MPYVEKNGIWTWKEKKKRKWFKTSRILAIITLVSVISSLIFGSSSLVLQKQNEDLQNSLYNFSPFIFSNYSSTNQVHNTIFTPDQNGLYLIGPVNVDLKVLSPYDGMLTITVKSLKFTYINDPNSMARTYLDSRLLNYSSVSYFPPSTENYTYFISKGIINPIEGNLLVETFVYLNTSVIQKTFQNGTTGIGFYLGDITFQANLFEAQVNRNYFQSFTEGVWCNIDSNPT